MTEAVAFALLLFGAAIKGVIGLGLPMVSIPMLTLFVGLPQALAIVVLPVLAANAWQVWQFRRGPADRMPMGRFLLSGAVGVGVGTWMLASVPAAWLETTLDVLLLAYLALRIGQPAMTLPRNAARRLLVGTGFASGALHGATGISGPIGITYFHAMHLPRPEFIYCTGVMFFGFTAAQVPMLWMAGFLNLHTFAIGVLCLPAIAAGLWLGNRIARRLDPRIFNWLVLVVLAWTALSLLWRAVPELLG